MNGYKLDASNRFCKDIDECLEGKHNCGQNVKCINTNGSFICKCLIGYQLDSSVVNFVKT